MVRVRRRLYGRQPLRRKPYRLGSPNSASSKRRRFKAVIIVPILLAAFGGMIGAVITFYLSAQQEVRAQRAVETDQVAADGRTPAVGVENQRYAEGVLHSASTSRRLELPEVQRALHSESSILPTGENVGVGEIQRIDSEPSQPRVFDQLFFTLIGQHYTPVEITDISIRVIKRQDPLSGTLVRAPPQGANVDESIGFDLDSGDRKAKVMIAGGSNPADSDHNYFDEKQVTLQRDERLEFKVTVFTATCYCDFVFDITTDDGQVVTATDNGSPWHVSAFASKYERAYAIDLAGPLPQVVPCSWPEDCLNY